MKTKQRNIIVFGATSAVAQEVSKIHAMNKDNITLIARNETNNQSISQDLLIRGAGTIKTITSDLSNTKSHENLISSLTQIEEKTDIYYFFYGSLPDQSKCESSWTDAEDTIITNFLSVASLLTRVANIIEQNGYGKIVVVSSVAGDRGRGSNYVYGSAKGALSIFLQGLRNRLFKSGGSVLNVKPGFIDTPMTAQIEKKGPLWSKPDKIARDIYKAVQNNRNEIYTPWFWGLIMLVIRAIPEAVFKRLSL